MPTLRYHGTRQQLVDALNHLVAALAGHEHDHTGAAAQLTKVMARACLLKVQDAYKKKSEGGTDEMGIKWHPLAPATLLLRRTGGGANRLRQRHKQHGKESAARRALIKEHAKRLARVVKGVDAASLRTARFILERKRKLGQISDSQYKSKSKLLGNLPAANEAHIYKTLLEKDKETLRAASFATILRDTGRLYRSFTPSPAATEQIMTFGPGWFEVGSSVPYLGYHQGAGHRRQKKGGGPRLPRRQILPDAGQIPESWYEAMQAAAADELAQPEFWRLLLGNKVS